jgi:hypothetical protein
MSGRIIAPSEALTKPAQEKPRPCCRDPRNLGSVHRTSDKGTTFRRCRVCGARHFEAIMDPGRLGLRF